MGTNGSTPVERAKATLGALFTAESPGSYRDCWRLFARNFLPLAVFYSLPYALVGDVAKAVVYALAFPALGFALTLGFAAQAGERRHAALSLVGGAAYLALVVRLSPVASAVGDLPWLALFFGWLLFVLVLVGYAVPRRR
ncbi:hypothetical protein [Halomicrococcus gelatinilyticus]|uniref:hypothetical protein n=1 Tax=Halomicrococcus gelatinilyticus TaxID=1702103 RepID=UPI002E12A240